MHKPTSPASFLRSPATGPQPQAQPLRVVAVGAAPVKRTHQTEARVTLRLPNRVELNRAAVGTLNIGAAGIGKPASAIDLISPRRGGGKQWLLDTRSTAACRLLESKGRHFFRTAAPPDTRYLPASIHPSRLVFDIGPELTERVCVTLPATEVSPARHACEVRGTGVYVLLPRRA